MGFFSKLFRQKAIDKNEPLPLNTPTDLQHYQQITEVVVVSEALKNELKQKLKQAFENPKSFYDSDNEFILSERGLTFPAKANLTAKFVLVDTLIDNDQMAEVDWKEDEEEVRFAINRILKAKNYGVALADECKYEDNETFEILEEIDTQELKPKGFSLEILDIDSDSYVFTIVPLTNHEEVSKMFNQIK